MAATINIPTLLTIHFAPLCQAFERHLKDETPPEDITERENPKHQRIELTRGQTTAWLPIETIKLLKKLELSDQERAHLFRLIPKQLVSYFDMARRDYLEHRDTPKLCDVFKNGAFALTRVNQETDKPRPLRRPAARCGVDPDSVQVRTFRLAHMILARMGMRTVIGDKTHTFETLVTTGDTIPLKGTQIDGGAHKGGLWIIARLNPELFSLSLSRFAQIESSALTELNPSEFLTYAMIEGQRAYKGRSEAETTLELGHERVIRDSGNLMMTSTGWSKPLKRLARCTQKLIEKGYLKACEIAKNQKWRFTLPERLPESDPLTREVACAPQSEPEKFPWSHLKLLILQAVMLSRERLVRTLVECDSRAPHALLTQREGSSEGLGALLEPG